MTAWFNALTTVADVENKRNAMQEPVGIELDAFDNFGVSAINAIPQAAISAKRAIEYLALPNVSGYRSDIVPTKENFNKSIQNNVRNTLINEDTKTIDYFKPNPETTGYASQFANEAIQALTKGGIYAGMFGGVGGAFAFGADAGANESVNLQNKGVDQNTADKAGLVSGVANTIGVALPAGRVFKKLAPDLAATVGANVSLNATARGVEGKLLNNNGYAEQGKNYRAGDLNAIALDAITPLPFLGLARLTHIDSPLSKSEKDVIRADIVAKHQQEGSAPGAPADILAEHIHSENIISGMQALLEDAPIKLHKKTEQASFIPRQNDLLIKELVNQTLQTETNNPIISLRVMSYAPIVQKSAQANGLNENILLAQIDAESGGKVDAVSPAGARGLAQFMPKTAKQYGVDVTSAESSIDGQARYMADLSKMFDGDMKKALAAYNWGQGNINKAIKKHGDKWLENAPKETRQYVNKIMAKARQGNSAGDNLTLKTNDNFSQAVQEYSAINSKEAGSSDGGRILNTDLARELSPEYQADRSKSNDVHDAASQFIRDLYEKKLSEPVGEGRQPFVLFTAGGTGAGKSSSLDNVEGKILTDSADIIYDTNMSSFNSSVQKVEQALNSGRDVVIQYTYREPVDALANGALPRAERMGRTVPLDSHASTHIGASETIRKLEKKYENNSNVKFRFVDNSHGKGNSKVVSIDNLPKVADNNLLERLKNELENQYQAGNISEQTYAGTRSKYSESGTNSRPDSSASGEKPQRENATYQPDNRSPVNGPAEIQSAGRTTGTRASDEPARENSQSTGQSNDAGDAATETANEISGTAGRNGKSTEIADVRPLVEAIVKRRAAANQIGKEKQFDLALDLAKSFMAGESVSPKKFLNASNLFASDKPLSEAFGKLAEIAKQPAKQTRNKVTDTLQSYRILIEQINSISELNAIARDIQHNLVLSDAQVQELDNLLMDKMDGLSEPESNVSQSVDGTTNTPLKNDASTQSLDSKYSPSFQALESNPNLTVASGLKDTNGNDIPISAKELMQQVQADIEVAKKDANGFIAAVNCFLSKGY